MTRRVDEGEGLTKGSRLLELPTLTRPAKEAQYFFPMSSSMISFIGKSSSLA